MERFNINSETTQWNNLEEVYNELTQDIERTRYENKNIQERINFYKTLLHNIPALFFIVNLKNTDIIWKNREFDLLLSYTKLQEKYLIEQISKFYIHPKQYQNDRKKEYSIEVTNTGIFKIPSEKKDNTTYYFKGYTLSNDQNGKPIEVFITAFNLAEKINTDLQLEELVKENKRLKNKLAINMLTNREKEVVRLISQGMSSKKISEQLDLSFYTVETHRKNILRKIELNNTAELIRFATEAGLV